MRALKASLLICVLCVVASCASTQRTRDEESIGLFARLINSGRAETLSSMSAIPFLVDMEIVSSSADVDAFWRVLADAWFSVGEASLTISYPVTDTSYREFADTVEVKAFFSKYVVKGTRLLELKTADGRRILLLVSEAFGKRTIRGFKGPFSP
jgi:hypothetical protein